MTVIGVTGGIGSGKTTFCRFLESRGIPVIYADTLAKELMVSNDTLKKAIVDQFGRESYHEDGTLNRPYLASKAFSQNQIELLNAIVHPVVKSSVQRLIADFDKQGYSLVVYEAAILLNDGRPDFIDVVVWIDAQSQNRLDRVVHRDGTETSKVRERMDKQISIESVRDYVDIVIQNNGSLSDLKNQADKLIQEYVR
jgi:dephospho-CoA kinase